MELADAEASEILKEALQPNNDSEGQDLEWQQKKRFIYGLLYNRPEGEAHDIVEACSENGVEAWRKLHTRWHKAQKQSSTVIAEAIRSVSKSKTLDEVNNKLTELKILYNEYYDVCNEPYGEIERKADILRVVPFALQQRLQLETEDMDKESIQSLHNKVQNYIRNMSTGTAKMDISAGGEETKTTAHPEQKPPEEEYPEEGP